MLLRGCWCVYVNNFNINVVRKSITTVKQQSVAQQFDLCHVDLGKLQALLCLYETKF